MKKTRMPQRLLSLVLVLMMLISVLPVSAMAAELTPSDPETGLTATDVTNELTDSDRLAIFEENMDSDKVSRSEIPADDEMVRVIVQLDADSLLDVRNRTNASMSMLDFQQTDAAKAQLKDIANLQLSVMNTMESKGIPSSFTFSYTSVVSGFAAQVPYGKIHDIKNISGVEDVVLCQTYYTDSMGSATLGQALTAAEVAAYSNNTQYQGEGMLIGILDTGLDVNHEAFANAPAVQKLQKSSLSKLLYTLSEGEDGKTNVTAYSYAALWYAQKHSSSSLVLLTEDDLYKSGKVPFAFDYADADADVIPSADAVEKYGNDHGTHVAGITAGKTVDADGSVTFAGQSPEAQLAIFKVFSDSTNGASTDTILAALNDALLLDVDVINMSLGSNGGFGREAEGDLTTKYYDLVKSAGILLNCSAGNSYSSSQGGAKGDFTSVSDPDTGIISSSSSYDAALSVASVNANETAAFVTAQGRVPYQDVSGHDFTALLLGNDSSRTYEYVMVPNTGDTADYQGLDVTGKIAVVMRGGLSFEQKQLNAASAGAAGCIIYNNRDGYLLNMSVDNYKIPTVCISLANGQMMEAAQEKTLTVSKTEKGSVAMSDFSSWGPLPSLSLKPEITAPGGSIDTYDAYLFFQQLNKSTVEIPANGSIHVEVNAKVLGLDEYDKASDNTGTYVEGYVYADEVASAEGVKGDSHSIPVLGYYGSWTDPSMFDIGSYLEYHEAKTESRVPYMYAYNKNATKYQALTVQYAGDSGMYYFGGNPYVDETYDPNRAAINPDTTVFARATFSLIRNAADSRATITGENGTVYYDKASGSPTAGAYYYSNGGSWRNAQGYIGINNAPTKAAEGEKITVKVTEAPEYYVTYDAEGNATTNWDALGDGASRTYTAFIDRTEPVLSNVYFKEDVETGTRSLVLTAQDNRYVAAAFLIDYDKMSILDRTAGSPEGAAEGAATDISLDLSKAEGVDHLLVQVADYADNTATYKINLNKEELSGPVSVTLDKQSIKMYKGGTAALNAEVSPFGVKPDGVTWKSSDETVATVNERGIITGVNKGTATITAASIKDPTATASCVVTVQTVDTTLVGALMDTNGDAQFYTWDMEHDTTWKKLVNFETTKSVSASTFDARTGDVYLQDGSFNINKMDLDTGKTLATYPGFEGEIPMWDMEYSLVYSTEAKPMLASVYYTYFLSPKPVDNLDLSAFDLGLYLWLFADASYFTAVTSLGANKIDTDKDGVKDTDTELFLALDDAGNIWTMNVYPSVDKETGKDTWGASFGILESNLANVGYAANPTDDGDLYDSLYATVEGQELVLYLANFTGDASHVYRILLNEDTGKWEAADIGNFGDGVWPATLVGTMYHANEDAAKAVNAAMSKTTVHTAQAVEMTPAQIQRYNGAETQAAKGSLNTAAPVAAVVNLPMGDAAENATASNVTVSADEKTVTVNVLAKDAATNGLFTVDYDAANLTLTNVAFNTQYSSYKDASGKVTLGYVDLNGVTAGSTVATLTFTVNDPTALDKINVTVTETERNDQTVNNAETLAADLHTETETVNAKAATCTEDGYTGDVVCKACGKVITKGEVIPALGHKIELVGAKAATCTEDGYTGDEVCTVCGEIVKKGEVIPAMGHKIKLVGAKEPTCTEDGYTGDEVCTICGEIVKKGEVIKATGHQYKDGKCTVCGAADPNYKPSVKTGDESNTALWVLVMASAAMLAAAVVVLPRKKHSR